MINLPLTFLTSLLLGMRHATDPDHIVAVSTIVSHERSLWRACRIGALWGLGHTLTLFLVGGAILLWRLVFSPRLGLALELLVALMLVALGALNLRRAPGSAPAPRPGLRPLLIGIVHGLAGSAAATLLVLPLIHDLRWAALYLLVFGLGTVVGMALITLAIAAPSLYVAGRVARLSEGIRVAAGLSSLCFGLYLVYQIGFVDGLFTAHPRWTPQ